MTRKLCVAFGAVLLLSAVPRRLGAQAVTFDDRPSVRFGEALRIDFTTKLQGDMFETSPGPGSDEGGFDLTRRRIGIKGTVSTHVEFEVERELGSEARWRDVFVNVRTVRPVQLRAGQFKMPFSLEQLTSPTHLDFVYRSRAADLLAPGRSVGASLHGRVAGRTLGYDVGLFRQDGENARFGTNPGAGQTVAARLTVRPREAARRSGSMKDVEVGVNATSGDVSEGRYSLRGRLTSRSVFFAPVYVKGRRTRLGADLDWRPGPIGIRAEILRVEDERRDQALDGETLSPLHADGWYIAGTWAVAGRRAAKQAAAADWFSGWLKGIELAARIERLGFGSVNDTEPALRNPRAANVARMDEQALTFGVNWSVNRWTRIQVNAIREQVTDAARGSSAVPVAFWTRVCRLQFSM